MRIKHVPSHKRKFNFAFGKDNYGLNVEHLDMEIDKHVMKRIKAQRIHVVEIKKERLHLELVNVALNQQSCI